MKIFISAAEISSDIHAEKILKAIQRKLSEQRITVEWMGIGGPRVAALTGFRAIEAAENLRTMGFIEVMKRYSFFKALINRTATEIEKFKPDLILTFDYPDFHFRLMEKVVKEKLAPAALRICGIPPKVWVSRAKRIEKIRSFYHGVWVIFPFEKSLYEFHGIPVIYEGNPLLESLNSSSVKKPLETITVMPGSRDAELKYHLPVIPETLNLFAQKVGKKIRAQVPIPVGVKLSIVKDQLKNSSHVEYVFLENTSTQSLAETQIGLIKSGTSTLEAAVLNCVPVIFYRMNYFSELIFRWLIKGWGGYLGPVGLPNILLGVKKREDSFFPELLGPEATAQKLSEQLYILYSNTSRRTQLLEKCKTVKDLFYLGDANTSSADRSALRILDWKNRHPIKNKFDRMKSSPAIASVSFLWSMLNFVRRRLSAAGMLPTYQVNTPSILVGNLQAGGAGKTPIVIALAKEAISRGKKVVVVSRGYGSTKENPLGDEPQEILRSAPGVILSVNANRVKAIKEAEKQKPDLILFDDGFQNLGFRATTSLLAVTGRTRSEVAYRDFDSEVRFADFVIGTKGKFFRTPFTQKQFFEIQWKWDAPITQSVWLLCAIADPQELISFYTQQGLNIKKTILKSDHAPFMLDEVKKLISDAKDDGCILVMTEKDRVKIPTLLNDIHVLKRSIRNRDWIDAVFAATLI